MQRIPFSRARQKHIYAKWGDRVKDDSLLPFLFKLCNYFARCVCLAVLNTRRSEMEGKSSKSDLQRICCTIRSMHHQELGSCDEFEITINIYHLIWIKSTRPMLQMHFKRSVDHLNARESTRELSIACGRGTERYQNYFIEWTRNEIRWILRPFRVSTSTRPDCAFNPFRFICRRRRLHLKLKSDSAIVCVFCLFCTSY